jgi:hemoglobin
MDTRVPQVCVSGAMRESWISGKLIFREKKVTDLKDIENRRDIDKLMWSFYERMMVDPIIGFIFTHYAKLDLNAHIPVIADFWETILFQKPVYKRGPKAMEVHFDLNKKVRLRKQHFTRWLYLFHQTIDEHYAGTKAGLAKERSVSIAKLMQNRIGTLPDCAEM